MREKIRELKGEGPRMMTMMDDESKLFHRFGRREVYGIVDCYQGLCYDTD